MNLDLTLIEKKEDSSTTITATAVVTPDPPPPTPKGQARGVTPLTVKFTVNGTPKGVSPIDVNGHASIELKKLEAGKAYVVMAEVLGTTVPASATETITIPAPPAKKPTGPFGWTMMAMFWFGVWYFGPGLLTLFYIGLAMGALALIARRKGKSFGTIVSDNNWVFPATLGMFIMSGLAAHWNPMVPEGTLGWIGGLIGGGDVEESILWGFLNNLFFREIFTNGWSDATWLFLVSLLPAALVSFTDEVLKGFAEFFKKHKGDGISWLAFLKKDLIVEGFEIFGKSIWKGFSNIFKVFLLVVITSTFVACSSPSEKEYKRLLAEKPATTTEAAEKAYDRVDKLAGNVARLKNPPEGLVEKIDELRKERATQYAKLAFKEKSVLSTVKVLAVLAKNGINPATIMPTPTPGVDTTNNTKTGSGTGAVEKQLSRPPVDPTADVIPPEWK